MKIASRAALCAAASFASLTVGLGNFAQATTIPTGYSIQLQFRGAVAGTAFNAPDGTTINSVSPSINDAGNVAFKLNGIGVTTNQGLWFGGHGAGGPVFNTGSTTPVLSDAVINNNNKVSFPRIDSGNDKLYVYDNATGLTTPMPNAPGASYGSTQINDSNIIGARYKVNTPQYYGTYNTADNTFTHYANETGTYNFLYSPAFNNSNHMVAQVNLAAFGSGYKEIRLFTGGPTPDGTSTLLAKGDTAGGQAYFNIDNSMSMNNNDVVIFSARTGSASSTKRIVVIDATTMSTTLLPTVSSGAGFTSIDSFSPVINDSGLIAFRGNDNQASAKDSIFLSDGVNISRLIGVGDSVQTDLGARTISSLSGALDINANGDIVFSAALNSGGTAVFVASTPEPASIASIGFAGAALALRRRRR